MTITVDHLLRARNRSARIATENGRRHAKKASARYDGHLTVLPLARGDMAAWVRCSVPGCRARGSGTSDYGYRPATVEFTVAGWSLGMFCEAHGREVRGVYAELAPAEKWTRWVAGLNPRVARRSR